MEIKSNELRIGNYVSHFGFEHQIEAIHSKSLLGDKHRHIVTKNDLETFLLNLKPITLNESWFLKFGFEKIESHKYSEEMWEHESALFEIHKFENCYRVAVRGIEECSGWTHYISDFKYVHQLQNIVYSLTNKELNIETE